MGKRGRDATCCSSHAGEEARRPARKKHLYLAVDDWEKGYSIHKVDVDTFHHDDDETDDVGAPWSRPVAERLREPPVLRLQASRGSHGAIFGAIGGKILTLWQPRHRPTRTVVYDTETAGVVADGPVHPADLHPIESVAAAGGTLYALHSGGLHYLAEAPAPANGPAEVYGRPEEDAEWVWRRACSSPLSLPFVSGDGEPAPSAGFPVQITAYAAHPDGRFFVSAHGPFFSNKYTGTFSFDTGRRHGGGEWTRHGDWLLPFIGEGHYDRRLDAWVGFHSALHVCACGVPPAGSGETPAPEWELVKAHQLFRTNPYNVDRFTYMKLVGMGDAKFCIVESLTTEGGELSPYMAEHMDEYVLRLAKFRVKRCRHGQLHASSRRAAFYRLHKSDLISAPQAFWI
ncbi:hypothetical protein ACP4OV_007396 [Aristida adscensionis]